MREEGGGGGYLRRKLVLEMALRVGAYSGKGTYKGMGPYSKKLQYSIKSFLGDNVRHDSVSNKMNY